MTVLSPQWNFLYTAKTTSWWWIRDLALFSSELLRARTPHTPSTLCMWRTLDGELIPWLTPVRPTTKYDPCLTSPMMCHRHCVWARLACQGRVFSYHLWWVNTSPPGQNDRYFADDILICILVNEKFCILIKISLKFVSNGPIENNPA